MRRREFITGLGSTAAWPLVAQAQQQPPPTVGLLLPTGPDASREMIAAFHQGLTETGYVEGRNLGVEYRWAEGRVDRIQALVAELVGGRFAVIVVIGSTPGALALKAATQTIPIVFSIGPDPVATGLVASLNHPGGNLTGVTVSNVQVIAKRLELLHEFVPAATLIALLVNPTNAAATQAELMETQSAAQALGLRLMVVTASKPDEIEAAFAAVVAERAGALVISGETFFTAQRNQLVALASRHGLPAIHTSPEWVKAGGLMSYGTNSADSYRIVGTYAGRILKGEKPGDLPIQLATKILLALNLKTAKALGLTFPTTLLLRADEVIE
jgi:putative tryptophan/tyrosine transport system substrate-binding protein